MSHPHEHVASFLCAGNRETHGFKSQIAAAEAFSCQTEEEGSVFLIYSAPLQLLLKIIHHYIADGSKIFI